MNSVAPIASLASTADTLLEDLEPTEDAADGDHLQDVRGAVNTIARRSEGLLNFVKAYRSVTRIPAPNRERFEVSNLVNDVADLMRPYMDEHGILFEHSVTPNSLELDADQEMIEQVLINLVKNAGEAVTDAPGDPAGGRPRVSLKAFVDTRGHSIVEVADNGPGIAADVLEKIFVPFFTTKKEGSGIGLSLSREVMRQHGGTIALSSSSDGTVARLRF
jgi:signal transduction histidine kinase